VQSVSMCTGVQHTWVQGAEVTRGVYGGVRVGGLQVRGRE